MAFPATRMRRLRRTERLRGLTRETVLAPSSLIQPLFIVDGEGVAEDIEAMPGQQRLSVDVAVKRARELEDLGVGGVLLFGVPDAKDAFGSGADEPQGLVARALRALRAEVGDLILIADVCLCEYTSHGHCGVIADAAIGGPAHDRVANDPSLARLAAAAVAYAAAGADIIAPSDMMDGRVAAIRHALDGAQGAEVAILSYAVKYASAYYGPFRAAARSAPQWGDRRGYQMDPANVREALREVELDLAEGADAVMVKPAMPYLDVIHRIRTRFDVPVAAYQVSGEYAQIKAAAAAGWLDEGAVVAESLLACRRAGADITVTYFAGDVAARARGAGSGERS